MFEQDYMMRLIHEVIRSLLKLLFNINLEKKEELLFEEQDVEEKYEELLDLIDKGNINVAENKLLDELNPEDINHYKMAIMFYSYLNEKEIDFLEEHDYTKHEITEGLIAVSRIYGYGGILETLLSIIN